MKGTGADEVGDEGHDDDEAEHPDEVEESDGAAEDGDHGDEGGEEADAETPGDHAANFLFDDGVADRFGDAEPVEGFEFVFTLDEIAGGHDTDADTAQDDTEPAENVEDGDVGVLDFVEGGEAFLGGGDFSTEVGGGFLEVGFGVSVG